MTRPGRSSDSQRLAALITIWPRLTRPASLQQLCRSCHLDPSSPDIYPPAPNIAYRNLSGLSMPSGYGTLPSSSIFCTAIEDSLTPSKGERSSVKNSWKETIRRPWIPSWTEGASVTAVSALRPQRAPVPAVQSGLTTILLTLPEKTSSGWTLPEANLLKASRAVGKVLSDSAIQMIN